MSTKSNASYAVAAICVIALLAFGIPSLIGVFSSFSKADGGHVIVVRNGGLFDDNSIRQVIAPNSGLVYTGLWSTDHEYPTSQRNFKISAAEGGDSQEVINVPTRDGVLVGIEGTFYFQLTGDETALRAFDDKFGTRAFAGKAAWDGDEGWSNFLDFTLSNLVQNVLRQEIGQVYCRELVASCALAQNNAASVDLSNAEGGNATIAEIQQAVNETFAAQVQDILGVPWLTNVQFALSKVSLPQNIQDAINAAQAKFAETGAAQAAQQAAKIDAETNDIRQQGYQKCPVCAEIDLIKALPQGLTVYAPGGDFAVTQPK